MKNRPSGEILPRGVDQKPFFAVLNVWAKRHTLESFPSVSTHTISFSHGPSTDNGVAGVLGLLGRYVVRQMGVVSSALALFQEKCWSYQYPSVRLNPVTS